ncbi:MAG: FtsQ-type POTRA domain-containing protein, partial [Lachnospiraceae bacterium]|nr:FtsQ-type POTRA domain-containing protein [Lachnospiraceae bacterium]
FVYLGCNVKKVNIKGNNLYEDDVIKRVILDDEYSFNTLYVYLKYKFKKPESLPFIDSMEVTMDGLNELTIKVYEKKIISILSSKLPFSSCASSGITLSFFNIGLLYPDTFRYIQHNADFRK